MQEVSRRGFLAGTGFALLALSGARRLTAAEAARTAAPEVLAGGVRMIDIDGKHRVWTKKIGKGRIKLLTLAGGPGCSHEYFECFESFLPDEGVELYYYDQLGAGYSDRPDDPSLWVIPRFVAELESVRKGLGLDDFYLYGHSWGGILAIEYALQFQQHLKGIVISNMTASIPSYLKRVNRLVDALPDEVRKPIREHEAKGDLDNPEYQKAIEVFYQRHICRLDPWPEPVTRMLSRFAEPPSQQVYNTMQGKNETQVTGNLKDWDRWADLTKIKPPTLTIGARWDEMEPADMEKMAELLPNGRYGYCPNGSHLCMWDDQQAYFRHLTGFLRDVDAGRMKRAG